MENETKVQKDWFYAKFAMLIGFVFADLYLNSKAEYEALQPHQTENEMNQLQFIVFGCIILSQVSVFSTFFLILCDTYPLQVGLLGVLAHQFKCFLIFQSLYTTISSIVGCMRLVRKSYFFAINYYC